MYFSKAQYCLTIITAIHVGAGCSVVSNSEHDKRRVIGQSESAPQTQTNKEAEALIAVYNVDDLERADGKRVVAIGIIRDLGKDGCAIEIGGRAVRLNESPLPASIVNKSVRIVGTASAVRLDSRPDLVTGIPAQRPIGSGKSVRIVVESWKQL